MGAAQPQRSARRGQDHSPGARSDVHGIPGWGFPADLPVTGCSEVSLPVLIGIIRAKLAAGAVVKSKIEERRKKTEAEHNEMIREMDANVAR